jgi:hypothetical protein
MSVHVVEALELDLQHSSWMLHRALGGRAYPPSPLLQPPRLSLWQPAEDRLLGLEGLLEQPLDLCVVKEGRVGPASQGRGSGLEEKELGGGSGERGQGYE